MPFEPGAHAAAATRVPALLAEEWRCCGFGAHKDGLLWTLPPDDPVLDPADWPELDPDCVQVLRSAFGNVWVWQRGEFAVLLVHAGQLTPFTADPDILFESSLVEEHFRKYVLMEPLFKKARKKLGPIAADECYGFAPTPALGGDMSAEYLVKVKIREYLAMLAQLRA